MALKFDVGFSEDENLKWRKSMEVGMLGAAPCCFFCSHTILPQHASPVERGGI